MTTTVSSKNQIVIPKAIRLKTGVGPKTKLYPSVNKQGDIVFSTKPKWHAYKGKFAGVWGDDPVKTIRELRDAE
jgi:bifunctional DNA-binding transcriptional regulator/antitoxin component of YhaV-PrlF toxin-antitoxin module